MSSTVLFYINLVLFVLCAFIQFRALNRRAFGRAIFITIAMFFFTFIVYVAPHAPLYLAWILFAATWIYTLFMTSYAISRKRK
ncbi:MAG: hypothetical protein ACXVPC_05855 [Tumebacillaceae bacterium]